MVELNARADLTSVNEPKRVALLTMSWTDPVTEERLTQETYLDTPHPVNQLPVGGYFTNATVEKGFVMLNIFVGFLMAADFAVDSDIGAARGVLTPLRDRVAEWLTQHEDPDITDDLEYIDLFLENLLKAEFQTPVSTPPEPWEVYYY